MRLSHFVSLCYEQRGDTFRDNFRRCTDNEVNSLNRMSLTGLPETGWEAYGYGSVEELADPGKALVRWLGGRRGACSATVRGSGIEPGSGDSILSKPRNNLSMGLSKGPGRALIGLKKAHHEVAETYDRKKRRLPENKISMRAEIKITFKDPTQEPGKNTETYLDVYAGGVLICEAYPKRGADDTTYRIRTADLALGLDERRLFEGLDAVAKHVRFCIGNSSRGVSYLRKEAGVDAAWLIFPCSPDKTGPRQPDLHNPVRGAAGAMTSRRW